MIFTELLNQLNIPYKTEGHHHCRPGWVQIDCPFCGKDSRKWHMGYSIQNHFFNCWRCGSHSAIDTLMELTSLSYRECNKLLSQIDNSYLIKEKIFKPKGKVIIPKGVRDLLPAHKKYLRQRGFNPDLIAELWGIKGIGISSKLNWRIFIPIFYQNKIVSWTTRSISNHRNVTRYINASKKEESIPHKSLLYGEQYAQHSIVITEGPFDVWRIGPGAVATLGLNYSQAQLSKIIQYPIRAICFDNQPVAQKKAKELLDNLSVFPGESYNIVLDSKDAAEASKREIERIRYKFLNP